MTISSRKAGVRASLALSCVGSALLPLAATPLHAQSTASQGEGRSLSGMTVTSTALGDEVPGRQQSSPKAVRSVRDTPQTITVLGKEVLQQQNLISLQEALQTVPGITFGAGEGGSGYGDSITFRGYSANTDITIDGVRDSAQYSRTDNFNIEQIEVTNGASSVQNGSGSVGGNINLVTKRPLDHNQAIFQAGLGTDNYYRATADVNRMLTDNIAFRLNAMYHHNDIPGRQVEQNDRWGIAPAITFGMGGDTQLTLEWYHQQDKNIPQYGLPYFASQTALNGYSGIMPGVDRSAYFGYKNIDHQRINVDQYNIIFDHQFSDKVKVRNLFRYQDLTQDTLSDGPEGTFCLPLSQTAIGLPCGTVTINPTSSKTQAITVVAGQFYPNGGSRGNTRFTRNQLSYNQTDLTAVVNTGFIEHTLDFGVALSRESYKAVTGNSERNADGSTPVFQAYNIYDPNNANVYTGPLNFLVGARNYNRVENYAVYLFDAMKLSDHFEINGGVRWERNVGRFMTDTTNRTFGNASYGLLTQTTGSNVNSLFSYRIGLVYKPIEAVTAYVAYGNSKTPSQNTVNGACTATATSATCKTSPEGAKNYEIGVKAEVLDNLLLTAALFRNERDSYKVPSGDTTVPDQTTDGQSRVQGISIGASGNITPNWSVTANYTYLESKLIQSVSSRCLANPGSGNCLNTLAHPNPGAGAELLQVPKHSGSVFTTYRFPFGLMLGYGATYQGSFALNTPGFTTTTTLPLSDTNYSNVVYRSKAYLIHNATISYDFTKQISLQVNVKNIGDKLYYTRIRPNNGWATPGDGRSAVATLTVKM